MRATGGAKVLRVETPEALLRVAAPLLEAKLRDNPMLVDVSSDLQLKNPQIDININRDKAASLGVTARQIEEALYTAYGNRQISTIFAPNNQYRVIMELLPEYKTDILDLSLLYIRSSNGDLVPLGHPEVADLRIDLTDSGQVFNALSAYAGFDELESGTGVPRYDAVVHFATEASVIS